MSNDICYNCSFIYYDCMCGNGYCNNIKSNNYKKLVITDNEGCTINICSDYLYDYESEDDTNVPNIFD